MGLFFWPLYYQLNTPMKRIIFVLTYTEGPKWVNQYPPEKINDFFPQDLYTVIVLDNGRQPCMEQWCKDTGNVWFPTDNNLGTTGGYNWFIKTGAMLGCERIAVMQADVEFCDKSVINHLFVNKDNVAWYPREFTYYPNHDRHHWREGHVPDVGQFFSLNPKFFVSNDYLCDENYTVTHFESVDLWVRMVNAENVNPAVPVNLADVFYTRSDYSIEDQIKHDATIYTFHSYSNKKSEHDRWYVYNFEYYQRKWRYNRRQMSGDEAFRAYWSGKMTATRFDRPWGQVDDSGEYVKTQWHHQPLDVQRNIAVGQLPYPVEYEINRFYQTFVSTGICNSW